MSADFATASMISNLFTWVPFRYSLAGETGNCFRLRAEDRKIVLAIELPNVLYNKAKILVSSELPRDRSFRAQRDVEKNGNAFRIPVGSKQGNQCLTALTASVEATAGIATASVFSGKGSGLRSSARSSTSPIHLTGWMCR